MNDQFILLTSLAMDLKRSALGSESVSKRFLSEAMKRKTELDKERFPNYISDILENLENEKDRENLLMYSILLQNYSRKQWKKSIYS